MNERHTFCRCGHVEATHFALMLSVKRPDGTFGVRENEYMCQARNCFCRTFVVDTRLRSKILRKVKP